MTSDDPWKAVEEARAMIDDIDLQLVELLNRRAKAAGCIGEAKQRLGEPIYQPDREEQIFARVTAVNAGPLDDGAVRRLFERVLDESRRLERTT